MNLGIDIGSTKTVIYSTKEHGTIVEDEFGKREIPSVLERTKPVRSFGKSVSGDNIENLRLRRRFFLNDLSVSENRENLFMFLNYLHRTILLKGDYKDACLAIPDCYCLKDREVLKSIVINSDLKVGAFLTHITSIAACAALRNYSIPETYMIIDCGYSKTSVGVFSFKESKLVPLMKWSVPIGGKDFDEVINKVLIKKYNLPDSDITREKIYKEINTVKRGLNDLPSVNLKIFTENYEISKMTVEREEYVNGLSTILESLSTFFETVKNESKYEGYIEVVGNNSHNAFMQNILKRAEFKTTLSSSESAALGACLAHGVNSRKMQFRVDETFDSEITVKLRDEDVKPTRIYAKNSVIIPNEVTKIKYMRKSGFMLDVYANGILASTIRISKKQTESPEEVVVKVCMTPFLTFEVRSVEGGTETTFEVEGSGLETETIEALKGVEQSFRESEVEIKTIGEKRNYLENLVDSFDSAIARVFPELITAEDKKKIESIRDAFFDNPPVCKTVKEEEALKNSILESLSFVGDKLKTIESTVRAEGEHILKEFDESIIKELTYNTQQLRNLNLHIYNLRGFLSSLKLDLETVSTYETRVFEELKKQISTGVTLARMEQENELRKEQEQRRKTQEEKEKHTCGEKCKEECAKKEEHPCGEQCGATCGASSKSGECNASQKSGCCSAGECKASQKSGCCSAGECNASKDKKKSHKH